jgi:hypothetical protein
VKLCSIDESLIGYQPSEEVKKRNENQGHPIPVSYIPRKPHSNGLLNYILTTTVEHPMNEKGLPYILDILPHLQQGDCSPHLALKKFLDRWCKTEKTPYICRLGFWFSHYNGTCRKLGRYSNIFNSRK